MKKHVIAFLRDLIESLDVESGAVRVSVVLFGDDAKVQFQLSDLTKEKKLMKALKSIKPKQYRSKKISLLNLLDTLKTEVFTEANGDRRDVPNIAVVINDVETKEDVNEILRSSLDLKQGNDRIIAIGLEKSNEGEMQMLGRGYTDTLYFFGDKYDYLTKSTDLRESLARQFKVCKFITHNDKNEPLRYKIKIKTYNRNY